MASKNLTKKYLKEVEKNWEQRSRYVKRSKRRPTTKRDVLAYMLQKKWRTWFWSWELNGVMLDGVRLSHRSCARASDLAIHHSDLVECRKQGRFAAYRVRRENLDKIHSFLGIG